MSRTGYTKAWPAFLVLLLAFAPTSLSAAELTVTKIADTADGSCDPDCSLREAIIEANLNVDHDTIIIPGGLGTYTLTGSSGEDSAATGDLDINTDMTLEGDGATTTIIDGADVDRIFDINPSGNSSLVVINGITIQNGSEPGRGGGILINPSGTLTLRNSIVQDNEVTIAGGSGGGIQNEGDLIIENSDILINRALNNSNGGGIINVGNLTMSDCTVIGNQVSSTFSGGGGGLFNAGGVIDIDNCTIAQNSANFSGGGIFNNFGGTLTIKNSLIDRNTATSLGGGIHNEDDSSVTVSDSTLTGNQALGFGFPSGAGAGIANIDNGDVIITRSTLDRNDADFGGAIYSDGNSFTLGDSTVSANTATDIGGGIYHDFNTIALTNVTVTDNESLFADGGGIYNDFATVTLQNTILAANRDDFNDAPDCAGETIDSLGNNLLGDDSGCSFASLISDLVGTGNNPINPRLGPLQENGGPTETHALLDNSPAIDSADDASCPAVDQRGEIRPAGNSCDMGAYELSDCSDGIVQTLAGEECDDGPANSDTLPDACRIDCTNARCGDNVIDTGETCDDGNNADGDGCPADCVLPTIISDDDSGTDETDESATDTDDTSPTAGPTLAGGTCKGTGSIVAVSSHSPLLSYWLMGLTLITLGIRRRF